MDPLCPSIHQPPVHIEWTPYARPFTSQPPAHTPPPPHPPPHTPVQCQPPSPIWCVPDDLSHCAGAHPYAPPPNTNMPSLTPPHPPHTQTHTLCWQCHVSWTMMMMMMQMSIASVQHTHIHIHTHTCACAITDPCCCWLTMLSTQQMESVNNSVHTHTHTHIRPPLVQCFSVWSGVYPRTSAVEVMPHTHAAWPHHHPPFSTLQKDDWFRVTAHGSSQST
jgi:hypothetical protein